MKGLAAAHGAVDARREVQILLGHALGVSRGWLSAHADDLVEPPAAAVFREFIRRRQAGEPVAYLTGKREFHGLDFLVTPDVLIPRADTETLVDAALENLARAQRSDVLDLGTGSGCIAVTIAHERPAARVTAIDISAAALNIARANAAALGVSIGFVQGAWFGPLAACCFDLIVSNPPYVAAGDPHLSRGDLRFEPGTALVSDRDGLADIRRIVREAPKHLRPGGWLLLEHGYDQSEACRNLLIDAGFGQLTTRLDLAGIPRVAAGRLLTPKSPNR
jgi:release factor glutamine methyltransferase